MNEEGTSTRLGSMANMDFDGDNDDKRCESAVRLTSGGVTGENEPKKL